MLKYEIRRKNIDLEKEKKPKAKKKYIIEINNIL